MQTVVAALMDQYNTIIAALDAGFKQIEAKQTADYRPLYLAAGGKPSHDVVRTWVRGFGKVPYTARSVIGKAIATFVPNYMFFALGYEHMVVNMFIIPAAMLFGAPITMYDFWTGNEFR